MIGYKSILKCLVPYALAQALLACSGGGGSTQVAGIEGSGVTAPYTGNVVGAGQITGFGSIFVNGIEYSLDHSSVDINGAAGSETQLAIGQVVTVSGKFGDEPTQAAATKVSYEADVIGPISAVDRAHRQITVLGQTVSIDADQVPTIIDASITPAVIEGLIVGREIELSGFVNSQGILSARRIAARSAGSAYAVNGVVERIDQTHKSFSIKALGVDFSAADLSALAGVALKNGDVVRVEGQQINGSGTLLANKVSPHALGLPGSTGDTAIVEGWITRFVSTSDFDVNGHPIVGSANTKILPPPAPTGDPLGLSTLRLDRFVTVYGQLRSDGKINAVQVAIVNNVYANITIGSCSSNPACTKGTQVVIDGVPAATDDLEPGDLVTAYNYWLPDYSQTTPFKNVTIHGSLDSKMKNIVVEHTVRGPLEAIDADTGTLRIMGQSVVTGLLEPYIFGKPGGSDNPYWRDQKILHTFTPGQMLEVSGYETPKGDIVATGIDSGAGKDLRVIGTASSVDTLAMRFRIQGQSIDFSNAFMDGFAGAPFHDGDRVLASGDTRDSSGILLAKRVSFLGHEIRGTRSTIVRYDGAITRYASLTDFDVAGLPVILTPTVTKIGGCGQPRVNAFISIYGVIDADSKVRSNVEPDLWCYSTNGPHLQGPITAIDLQRGVVDVLGVKLAIFEQTLITDDDIIGLQTSPVYLSLSDLRVGNNISVSGLIGITDQHWSRVRIARTGTQEPPSVEGGVQSVQAPDLSVAGVQVNTLPETTYADRCDNVRSATDAFSYLATSLQSAGPTSTPAVVHVGGSWAAPALVASHIKLQDMPLRPTDAECEVYY